MAQVFISYHSSDHDYAKKIWEVLRANRIDAWFAPSSISAGQDFAREIGNELAAEEDEDIEARRRELGKARVMVLVLSRGAMRSVWVKRELKLAIKRQLLILAIQVDHELLTPDFEYMLVDVDIIDGYGLHRAALEEMLSALRTGLELEKPSGREEKKRFLESELRVHRITGGDPYYEEGTTLFVTHSGNEFFLSPPHEALEDPAVREWSIANGFSVADRVFGQSAAEHARLIPEIPDLPDRIEASRRKIFRQFRHQENGCYFNNPKYGVEHVNPFGRTRDEREMPWLELRMFLTDYFTHRVMKDVCKTLVEEGKLDAARIDYVHIGAYRIFFTSLGIDLLLLEDAFREDQSVLITSRSTNAAETYEVQSYSLSVIEGVSVSDFDHYQNKIRLTLAAERGLIEELDVTGELIQPNTLRFYDFFVNKHNLEMGVSCSVELKKEFSIRDDVMLLHGKDEELEISDKRRVTLNDLEDFVRQNREAILPQALYVLCTFLEQRGILMIDRFRRGAKAKERFLCPKDGSGDVCGDRLVETEHFIAVIDGATPKGKRLWNGARGDVFVCDVLEEAICRLDPLIDARTAITALNEAVRKQYSLQGLDFAVLPSEEQLQASILLFSAARKEIWSFGDCMLRINQRSYRNVKKGDLLLSDLRAFCVEAEELLTQWQVDWTQGDFGREQILPYLKKLTLFANSPRSFGYDVINGGELIPEHVKIYAVQSGDRVVLASDGYPALFDTLEETERHLEKCLQEDPHCLGRLRGTKGVREHDVSFDDRCYISFAVS